MTNGRYILDQDGNPQPEPDLLKWARWFEDGMFRKIARDKLPNGWLVSTVFLGLDHNFGLTGPPVLWETMVFEDGKEIACERYSTRDQALAGHAKAIALGQRGLTIHERENA